MAAGPPAGSRAERRGRASAETRARILESARACLLADGYGALSTRRVAEAADVPLSQIHYYFGSRQELILAVLAAENDRLLARQAAMYSGTEPLWRQWEQACEFLEADLASGYVRVLQEMIAAGWSSEQVGDAVRELLGGWFSLLAEVARDAERRHGPLGPFTADEVATLVTTSFIGSEALLLLGFDRQLMPIRAALRRVGLVIRALEEGAAPRGGVCPPRNTDRPPVVAG
jgi:AcrR family transcriptional regulator